MLFNIIFWHYLRRVNSIRITGNGSGKESVAINTIYKKCVEISWHSCTTV